MEAMLKATEVAQLMGCSKEYVTRMAREGRLEHEKTLNERNRPMLLFPVSGLEPQLQQKYYAQLKANLPEVRLPDGAGPKCKTPKAFDQYTADEREEIAWWLKTVDEWQTYRAKYPGKKAEADEKFIALCAKIDPEHEFSIDILYRKWKAVKDNDLDGLIDKRGKWRKGKSSIDETLWQAFLSFYLDENQHPIMRCYEYTKMWAREDFPDLVADMPSYTTFYRRIQSDIPEAVEVLGRQGEKAFRDRCAPYIKRTYYVLNDISSADVPDDPNERIDAGELILVFDGEKYKIGRGVNSLVTFTTDKGEDFSKIKIMEGVDLYQDDIRDTFEESYVGKVRNDYDAKQMFVAAIRAYQKSLQPDVLDQSNDNTAAIDVEEQRLYIESKGIDTSAMDDTAVAKYNTGSKVFITSSVKFVDAMEDLKLVCNM